MVSSHLFIIYYYIILSLLSIQKLLSFFCRGLYLHFKSFSSRKLSETVSFFSFLFLLSFRFISYFILQTSLSANSPTGWWENLQIFTGIGRLKFTWPCQNNILKQFLTNPPSFSSSLQIIGKSKKTNFKGTKQDTLYNLHSRTRLKCVKKMFFFFF